MRDVFVAETDEEARRLFLEGPAGRSWDELVLPAFRTVRDRGGRPYALGELLLDPGMTMDELTLEWMVDHFFIVGSPDTVVEKITQFDEELGGIGALLSFTFDFSKDAVGRSGVGECTPGRFESARDGDTELMHFVSGKGTITSADGTVHDIRPGAVLIAPNGWRGTWDIRETVRKVYTIWVAVPDSP